MASAFIGSAEPLSESGLSQVLSQLGTEPAAVWAVVSVETSGCGFLRDRRPKILFERHIFHRETAGRFDDSASEVSDPVAGGYGPQGEHQYDRLTQALALDRRAALRSTSWGLGQIMGFNANQAGFPDVEQMVAAMVESEDSHLLAMASFIQTQGMDAALRDRRWDKFAERYNGPSYRINAYDTKLASFFQRYSDAPVPDLSVRAAQMLLMYLGLDPGPIDGVFGQKTSQALAVAGAPDLDGVDDSTLAFLKAKLASAPK